MGHSGVVKIILILMNTNIDETEHSLSLSYPHVIIHLVCCVELMSNLDLLHSPLLTNHSGGSIDCRYISYMWNAISNKWIVLCPVVRRASKTCSKSYCMDSEEMKKWLLIAQTWLS